MKITAHLFDGEKYNTEICKITKTISDNPNILYAYSKTFKSELILIKEGFNLLNQNKFSDYKEKTLKEKINSIIFFSKQFIINQFKNLKLWI